ncbi:hypothetical protein [Nostoc sp. FACHB-280]|nr:hypothetical protein [Nostoc sp. FACHB-280]MBD2495187.1 hypothetical protein [Nostoc sp. FACHB-280]
MAKAASSSGENSQNEDSGGINLKVILWQQMIDKNRKKLTESLDLYG